MSTPSLSLSALIRFSTLLAVETKGNFLHQLAAKSFIQEKQGHCPDMKHWKQISISKSANVVSKFTSFVAVDKDSNQPVSGALQKPFVPSYHKVSYAPLNYEPLLNTRRRRYLDGFQLDGISYSMPDTGMFDITAIPPGKRKRIFKGRPRSLRSRKSSTSTGCQMHHPKF